MEKRQTTKFSSQYGMSVGVNSWDSFLNFQQEKSEHQLFWIFLVQSTAGVW